MGVSCSGRAAAALQRHTLHMSVSVGLARWEPYAQLDDLRVQSLEYVLFCYGISLLFQYFLYILKWKSMW